VKDDDDVGGSFLTSPSLEASLALLPVAELSATISFLTSAYSALIAESLVLL